jgi:hypothetical protein
LTATTKELEIRNGFQPKLDHMNRMNNRDVKIYFSHIDSHYSPLSSLSSMTTIGVITVLALHCHQPTGNNCHAESPHALHHCYLCHATTYQHSAVSTTDSQMSLLSPHPPIPPLHVHCHNCQVSKLTSPLSSHHPTGNNRYCTTCTLWHH